MNLNKEIGCRFPILTYRLGGDNNNNNECICVVADTKCEGAVDNYYSWNDKYFLFIDIILSQEISQVLKLQIGS